MILLNPMKEFFRPTIAKLITTIGFLVLDFILSFVWIQIGFFNYYKLVPVGNYSSKLVPTNFSWTRFLIILAIAYILTCFLYRIVGQSKEVKVIISIIIPLLILLYLISMLVIF
jgi:hypothetical protein